MCNIEEISSLYGDLFQEFTNPNMILLHTYVSMCFNWFCLIGKVKRWICVHRLSHSKMIFHVTEGSQETV